MTKSTAQTKREEAARFIRARSDPVFAQMVRVRQLGPEQVENQKKIRLAVEVSLASRFCPRVYTNQCIHLDCSLFDPGQTRLTIIL